MVGGICREPTWWPAFPPVLVRERLTGDTVLVSFSRIRSVLTPGRTGLPPRSPPLYCAQVWGPQRAPGPWEDGHRDTHSGVCSHDVVTGVCSS